MQAHAKKRPTEVDIQIFEKHYRLPKDTAKGLTLILGGYEVEPEGNVSMYEVFPDLLDDVKRPAIALRGSRRKENMSQVALAKKLGIEQGDISKMERGERAISKKMAAKLAAALNVDRRIFL